MESTTKYNIVRLKPIQGAMTERHRLPDLWNTEYVETLVDLKNYRFFWFEEVETVRTIEDGVLTFRSKVLNRSSNYFINAFVETYEDILVNNENLAQQIVGLGWTHVVKGVNHNWIEKFNKDDKLIEA